MVGWHAAEAEGDGFEQRQGNFDGCPFASAEGADLDHRGHVWDTARDAREGAFDDG